VSLNSRIFQAVISGREMPFEAFIFPSYLRVIMKEIPECKRLEFVVSASPYEMHVMRVGPSFRFVEVRADGIVFVRDMHVAKHSERRDIAIKEVQGCDRLRREPYNRSGSVMFDAQGEGTEGRCKSVTLLGKCQGPTGIIANDVQCRHRLDRSASW